MKLTKWIIFGVSMIAASGLVGGLMFWRRAVDESRKLSYAEELVASDRATDALSVIEERLAKFGKVSDDWLEVDIEVRRQIGDLARLREIYYEAPDAFDNKEDAALLVARALIDNDDFSGFRSLHDAWKLKTKSRAGWLILQADALLKEGQREQAVHILSSEKCPGKSDCLRLIRLAILHAENPQLAWKHLDEAFELDPRNSFVRSYRGQLREATEDYLLARIEYVAAFVADPENALMCDQLAEYYRRRGEYKQMLNTWGGFSTEAGTDFIQLKYSFWSKVALPCEETPAIMIMPASGSLESLVSLIRETPSKRFWPSEKIERQSELPKSIVARRQEVFWLKTLQTIKDRDGATAQKYLSGMTHGQQSWNPRLERALRQILYYQVEKLGLDPDFRLPQSLDNEDPTKHSFFVDLDTAHSRHRATSKLDISNELELVLDHENAAALACVASGWFAAADKLLVDSPWPAGCPDYAPFAITQMLRVVRGPQQALAYAEKQPSSPSLDLLRAEIHLSLENIDKATKLLATIAEADSDAGNRAAWMWTLMAMEAEKYDEAEHRVSARESFQRTVQGQELTGRIEIFQGRDDKAAECYQRIERHSVEAKAFLARKAFAEEDWVRAESLTRELIRFMPDEPQLHANLEAIDDARRPETPAP